MLGCTWPTTALPRLLSLFLALNLSGCLEGESNDDSNAFAPINAETEYDHELTGSVGDGPIVGAAIRVTAKDGSVVAELESDASAGYSVTIRTKGKFYPLSIDARNGTDLVTNLVPDFDLHGAVIEPGKKSVANLNPFSTLAVELARNMNGGITKANLSAAEGIVTRSLNSGLLGLADSGPSTTLIEASNLAEIVKASETLGETVRRVRDVQSSTGRSASGNTVIQSVASDLMDSVIDGVGGQNVDPRIAALTVVISAQTLLESMQNELHVNDQVATGAMEAAMTAVSSSGSAISFEELTATGDMLDAVRVGLDACLAVAPSPALEELADAVASLQSGMTPAMIRPLVPDTYRSTLDLAITTVAGGSDADIETVNSISRNGGGMPSTSNGAPLISGTPATSIEEGAAYSFTPTASDPDTDPLTFTIAGQPAWATFDAATGTLSGTPASGSAGDYANIVIGVTDGEFTTELPEFTISVTVPDAGNTPPTISGDPRTEVEEGSDYSFTPSASDADGNPLTFSISSQPAWAAFDAGTGTLSGTPAVGDAGDYAGIVISVSDGQATTDLAPFSITVTALPVNSPPVISGTPASTVEVGSDFAFTPTAIDPDGDTLVFSIEGLPAWAAFNTNNGTLSGTPQAGDENVYDNIVISVSDGEFNESLAPFSIEVVAAASGTGSVTLTWTAPTQNEDGSALTDLAGFKLYWGTTQGSYPNSQPIDNPSVTTFTIDGLAAGTYYFVATAINEAGVESRYSGVATKVVP